MKNLNKTRPSLLGSTRRVPFGARSFGGRVGLAALALVVIAPAAAAFQSLSTTPSDSGFQSAGAYILSKDGSNTYDRATDSLEAISEKLDNQPWTVNGSDLYYSSGSLGIGTSTPSQPLDIESSSTTYTGLEIANTDTTERRWAILANSNGTTYGPSKGFAIRDVTGAATRLAIDTSGDVGIGTVSPSQALDLIGSLELEDTTTSTTGVIYKGTDRFIHNFHHPTGNTAIPDGKNTFLGVDSGNFTVGSTATATSQGSYNTGVGEMSLSSLTTGSSNSASGYYALSSNTIGGLNSAVGRESLLSNTLGSFNSAMGAYSLRYNTIGNNNSAMGYVALHTNTSGNDNSAVGYAALYTNTSGYSNSALGRNAGRYITGGSTANQTSNTSLYLGAETKALASGDTNEIVIGYDTTGFGSNTAAYGNSSITDHIFQAGNVGIGTTSPNGKLQVSGVPDGDGVSLSSATNFGTVDQSIGLNFTENTNTTIGSIVLGVEAAGRTGMALYAYNSGLSEVMRISGLGNVGIGTTSPATNLHVDDADDGVQVTIGEDTSSTSDTTGIQIASWSDNNVYYTSKLGTGGKILYRYGEGAQAGSSNTWMTMDGGNVGIGTTGPDRKLDVLDTTNPQLRLTHTDGTVYSDLQTDSNGILNINTSYASFSGLALGNPDSHHGRLTLAGHTTGESAGGRINLDTSADYDTTINQYVLRSYQDDLHIGPSTDIDALEYDGANNHWIFSQSGNVGIGTTSPGSKMDVQTATTAGYAAAVRLFNPDSTNGAAATGVHFGTTNSYKGLMAFRDSGGNGLGDFIFALQGESSNGQAADIDSDDDDIRMVILSTGNVGIGTTAPGLNFEVEHDTPWGGILIDRNSATRRDSEIRFAQQGTVRWSQGIDLGGNNTQNFYIYDAAAGANRILIDSSGNVGIGMTNPSVALDVTGSIEYTGTITDVSDERLKENIQNIENNLEKIVNIDPVSFEMKDDEEDQIQLGLIAQNVAEYFPEAVSIVDPEHEYLGLDYTQLIAPLIGSIRELKAENDELKVRIEALEKGL